MQLQELIEVCGGDAERWPEDWQEEFQNCAIFGLVGTDQFFSEMKVFKTTHKVAKVGEFAVDYQNIFPETLAAFFPGKSYQNDPSQFRLKDWGLDSIGNSTLRVVLEELPATFPKVLLTLIAFSKFYNGLKRSQPLHEVVQIRFLGYYVEGFPEYYKELAAPERVALGKLTVQVATVFEDMANGFPVSRKLADAVAKILAERFEAKIEVRSYSTIREGEDEITRLSRKPSALHPAKTERHRL